MAQMIVNPFITQANNKSWYKPPTVEDKLKALKAIDEALNKARQ